METRILGQQRAQELALELVVVATSVEDDIEDDRSVDLAAAFLQTPVQPVVEFLRMNVNERALCPRSRKPVGAGPCGRLPEHRRFGRLGRRRGRTFFLARSHQDEQDNQGERQP